MKKEIFVLLIFFLFINGYDWIDNPLATDYYAITTSQELFLNATTGGVLEPGSVVTNTWLLNWKLLAILVILISLGFAGLSHIIAKVFHINALKAWADIELSQIIVSGLLLGIIIIGLGIIDEGANILIHDIAETMGLSCPAGQQKSICLANKYLDDTFDIANFAAKDLMEDTLKQGRRAMLRQGWAMQTIPYFSYSESPDADLRLFVERNSILLDYYGDIMASLRVQKYFLNAIGFTIGPLFLIFGLIFRSFFLTRKMGGLLIAIGLGLIIVFPLTYVLIMYTLSVQVYGDQMFDPVSSDCPIECIQQYPIGFNKTDSTNITPLYTPGAFSEFLPSGTTFYDYPPGDLIWETIANDYDLVLCDAVCQDCPLGCRELPLGGSLCFCDEEACNYCPEACKIIRPRIDCYESNSTNYCPSYLCPNECKVNITPSLSNCWSPECNNCTADCRFNYADGTPRTSTHPHCNSDCDYCNCNVIMPSPYQINCDLACGDEYWERTTLGALASSSCPEGCLAYLPEATPATGCENCDGCDPSCRFTDPTLRNPTCNFSPCVNCPPDCMVDSLPLSPCIGCWECIPDCVRHPAIRTDCATVCGEIKGFYDIRPSELINRLQGADGEINTKTLGILMFPAFVLPLLSIILTIAFIRVFSQYLGGEYEIPGLERLI